MNPQLDDYLENLRSKLPQESIAKTRKLALRFVEEQIENFDFQSNMNGLLLGHVQSGKTAQMMSILAASNDYSPETFNIFLVLTTDNVSLQQQTLRRFYADLPGFDVFDEKDTQRFRSNFSDRAKPKPCIVVLKKNVGVLATWADEFGHIRERAETQPIFVLDDEADAASLDTLVNTTSPETSRINASLTRIIGKFGASVYLQVTATPQAILLQCQKNTGALRPQFAYAFKPGPGYLGGDFFYTHPHSYTHYPVPDGDGEFIHSKRLPTASYTRALLNFLLVSSYMEIKNKENGVKHVCNFLIHPGLENAKHDSFEEAITKSVFDVRTNVEKYEEVLLEIWGELQTHKPELVSLEILKSHFLSDNFDLSIRKLNKDTPESERDVSSGNNIIIGGNTLGRGVTFPSLQCVYYTRTVKTPQVDTIWQHCRMFGYDRDRDLVRVYMPVQMYNLFREVNLVNEALFTTVESKPSLEDIVFTAPTRTRATRSAVVDKDEMRIFPGGQDVFPHNPDEFSPDVVDRKIQELFGAEDGDYVCSVEEACAILRLFTDSGGNYFSLEDYASTIEAWASHKNSPDEVRVNIRRDRNISRGTGSLLSPTDRAKSRMGNGNPVLTLYRLTGLSMSPNPEDQWEKKTPFWVPNIRIPSGRAYYLSPTKS